MHSTAEIACRVLLCYQGLCPNSLSFYFKKIHLSRNKSLTVAANGAKYIEILNENLLQSAQDLRLGQKFTFQQDNDPKHTAKTTQEWLRDKSLNLLQWPSQSPELHPFKHLWRDLKIAVQRQSPSILTELERICREEWDELSKYRCAKLGASYPRILKAVIAA